MPRPEHRVRCLPTVTYQGGDERLPFEIDSALKAISLRIGGFNQKLIQSLPDRTLDLLEIAALVYGVDAAVSRGGATDRRMGRDWYRTFRIEMPVRDLTAWSDPGLRECLQDTLAFLSDDRFRFEFTAHEGQRVESGWFDFGEETGWRPDRIIMFSGGLDSFAGAIEEIADHGQRVALVSHFSSTKIAPIQKQLHKVLVERQGDGVARHFPMCIQLTGGSNREGTHRTRSFLFAVLGLVTAQAFGRDRVSFHENGVVSLNLPPVGNVISTRATRTTHPQTLQRFTQLFSKIFDEGCRVDNPFFFRTKTEVLQTIQRLQMADQVRWSNSCADTHNRTRQHSHCGRCSQCIDRRFAVLAARMESDDPGEAYSVDLLTGVRDRVDHREIALSYLRNALFFENLEPANLERQFPEINRAVGCMDRPTSTGLDLIVDLLRRHGSSVAQAMRRAIDTQPKRKFPDSSLTKLFGEIARAQLLGLPQIAHQEAQPIEPAKCVLTFDQKACSLDIDGRIKLKKSAAYKLLLALAETHLNAAGQGLDPFDYPLVKSIALANKLGLASDEHARKSVNRTRSLLRSRFASAGLDAELGATLIENCRWKGYRLNPDLVTVRMASHG